MGIRSPVLQHCKSTNLSHCHSDCLFKYIQAEKCNHFTKHGPVCSRHYKYVLSHMIDKLFPCREKDERHSKRKSATSFSTLTGLLVQKFWTQSDEFQMFKDEMLSKNRFVSGPLESWSLIFFLSLFFLNFNNLKF